jgi:hypothetical protein
MTTEDGSATRREGAVAPRAGSGVQWQHVRIVAEGPDDGAQALRLLEHAMGLPGVVHMLVLGSDERAAQIVGWAEPLCERGARAAGGPERRVIWIRNPELPEVGLFLAMLLWLPLPRVAVMNARDWVCARIADTERIDQQVLERAFGRG